MKKKKIEHEKKNPLDTRQDNKKRTLIIPTSGNLGISLATLAAKRQYRIIAILPERTSNDRIALLKALGVEILRSPNEVRPEAPESAYSVATKLAEQLKDAIVMNEVILADGMILKEDLIFCCCLLLRLNYVI